MFIVITIDKANAAFQENPNQITSILTDCITACNNGDLENGFDIPLHDHNGNTVGHMVTTEHEPHVRY